MSKANECKMCGGELILVGQLGRLRHYNCRHCGMWFSKSPKITRDEWDNVTKVEY